MMTQEEKLELLEVVLDMDKEDIDVTVSLEEMDEWDSLIVYSRTLRLRSV